MNEEEELDKFYLDDEAWDFWVTEDDSIEYLPLDEIREKKIDQLLDDQ